MPSQFNFSTIQNCYSEDIPTLDCICGPCPVKQQQQLWYVCVTLLSQQQQLSQHCRSAAAPVGCRANIKAFLSLFTYNDEAQEHCN